MEALFAGAPFRLWFEPEFGILLLVLSALVDLPYVVFTVLVVLSELAELKLRAGILDGALALPGVGILLLGSSLVNVP
jgi:hypothetical protein